MQFQFSFDKLSLCFCFQYQFVKYLKDKNSSQQICYYV